MDAPPIQYCRTEDGVNLAYWTLGEGPPVLVMFTHSLSHLRLEWEIPAFRRFYEALAHHFRVVRYNPRSSGLSDSADLQGPSGPLDVPAVLNAVGADRLAIVSCGGGALQAALVAGHLGRAISAWVALAPGLDPTTPRAVLGVTVLRTLGGTGPGVMARALDPDGQDPAPLTNLIEHAVTPAAFQRLVTVLPRIDTSGSLADVQAPTLVVHYPEEPMYPGGPEMAAGIAGARLVVRPGRGYPLFDPDPDGLVTLIREFLGDESSRAGNLPGHPTL